MSVSGRLLFQIDHVIITAGSHCQFIFGVAVVPLKIVCNRILLVSRDVHLMLLFLIDSECFGATAIPDRPCYYNCWFSLSIYIWSGCCSFKDRM